MDIQVSSNFERALFDAYGRDGAVVAGQMGELKASGGFSISQGAIDALRDTYVSGSASEDETRAAIASELAASGELLCPHSAVGVHVARQYLGATPMVTLATAHPAKFPDAVEAATAIRPPLPSRMANLYELPERVTRLPDDLGRLEDFIRDTRG